MKKLLSVFLVVISSQLVLAHPGGEHSHDSFMGAWAWLIFPIIAMIAIVWKYKFSDRPSKKTEL